MSENNPTHALFFLDQQIQIYQLILFKQKRFLFLFCLLLVLVFWLLVVLQTHTIIDLFVGYLLKVYTSMNLGVSYQVSLDVHRMMLQVQLH